MKLRCFFGLRHGRWHDANPKLERQWPAGCLGGEYITHELVPGYPVLIAEGHTIEETMAWLFTYQPDHPQHGDDPHHPRVIAKRIKAEQSPSERFNRPGMSGGNW